MSSKSTHHVLANVAQVVTTALWCKANVTGAHDASSRVTRSQEHTNLQSALLWIWVGKEAGHGGSENRASPACMID